MCPVGIIKSIKFSSIIIQGQSVGVINAEHGMQ